MVISLQTPISSLPLVGKAYQQRLEKLGIFTFGDLLNHYPTRYEDYRETIKIGQLKSGQQATVVGQIVKFQK